MSKISKLIKNPKLFFLDFFKKRFQIKKNTYDNNFFNDLVDLSFEQNPWIYLITKFNLRSGVITGDSDNSLSLNSNDFIYFINCLISISHKLKKKLILSYNNTVILFDYNNSLGFEKWFNKLIKNFKLIEDITITIEDFETFSIFLYDCDDYDFVFRSNNVFIKKSKVTALAEIFSLNFKNNEIIYKTPFPIDAVFTYVDSKDLNFINISNVYKDKLPLDYIQRYSSNNEIEYSVKSVLRFAPWIKNIYIVSNCAIPECFKHYNNIYWISHEKIFPYKNMLPNFNSHSIETCLHLIPKLNDHFIYFNDDVFLNQPSFYSDFFNTNGNPVYYIEPYGMINDFTKDNNFYFSASKNSYKLLKKLNVNYNANNLLAHAPFSLKKNKLFEVEILFGNQINITRSNKFRSKNDINLVSFLFPHYLLLTNQAHIKYTSHRIVRKFIDIKQYCKNKFLCFNNTNNYLNTFKKYCNFYYEFRY